MVETAAHLRLRRELDEVENLGLPPNALKIDRQISVLTGGDSSGSHQKATFCIQCTMRPTIGPYAGAALPLRLLFSSTYPWEGPRVVCTRRLWHPAVDALSGSLCLNILRLGWSPIFDLSTILLGIWLVLQGEVDDQETEDTTHIRESNPDIQGNVTVSNINDDGALNQEAARLQREDPKEFAAIVALTLRGGSHEGITYDNCMDMEEIL